MLDEQDLLVLRKMMGELLAESEARSTAKIDELGENLGALRESLDELRESLDELKEDHVLTREGVNHLIEWADKVDDASKFPLPQLFELRAVEK